ncbi:hypothetical protein BC830DRAFT_78021 [Chytriomyces sp. MP71]|nr:hypothetical protein BC830DRAFT_78021 [Chytriomyces sp. MP71]
MTGRADHDEREPLLQERDSDVASKACNNKQQTSITVDPSRHKRTSYKLATAGLLLAGIATAFCFISDSNGTLLKYHLLNYCDTLFGGYGSDNTSFSCSGHGVKVLGDKCLCDLGYTGSACSVALSSDVPTTNPKPETICLVLESFGPLGTSSPQHMDGQSSMNTELATSFARGCSYVFAKRNFNN